MISPTITPTAVPGRGPFQVHGINDAVTRELFLTWRARLARGLSFSCLIHTLAYAAIGGQSDLTTFLVSLMTGTACLAALIGPKDAWTPGSRRILNILGTAGILILYELVQNPDDPARWFVCPVATFTLFLLAALIQTRRLSIGPFTHLFTFALVSGVVFAAVLGTSDLLAKLILAFAAVQNWTAAKGAADSHLFRLKSHS